MRLFESLLIALSTYSAVPVPQFDWNEKNMRYAICFFPAVGVLCGAALWLWAVLAQATGMSGVLFAAIAACLPILVTGGIHMDGYLDTVDALSSHQTCEKKLAIMKDANCGAFAVIYGGVYLLAYAGFAYEVFAAAYFADLPAVRALSRAVGPVRGESAECAKVRHALRLHKRRPAPHGDSRACACRPRRRGGDGLDVSHGWRDGGGVCGGFRAQVSQIRAGTVWRRDRGHVGLLFAALRALRPDRRLDRRAAVIDIFFIRHGATEGNLRRRYIGRTDEPLCEAGIAQVKALQKRGLSVNRLFVSPMLRTRQTADILFPKMHYTVVDGLAETDFGRFEGKSADKLSDDPAYQAWVDAMCLTPIPEGESVTDFKTRCCEAFAETIKNVPDGSRVGFVVHGGVIMAIMEPYARPKKDFYAYHIGNGECLQGVYDGETIQIK